MSAALTGCASLAATTVTVKEGALRLPLGRYPGLTAPGGFLKVREEASGQLLYVLALEDGSHAVLSPICTHQGCTVDPEGLHLVCPCHGSTYTRAGQVVRGPAQEPLRRLPARVDENGILIIDFEGGE